MGKLSKKRPNRRKKLTERRKGRIEQRQEQLRKGDLVESWDEVVDEFKKRIELDWDFLISGYESNKDPMYSLYLWNEINLFWEIYDITMIEGQTDKLDREWIDEEMVGNIQSGIDTITEFGFPLLMGRLKELGIDFSPVMDGLYQGYDGNFMTSIDELIDESRHQDFEFEVYDFNKDDYESVKNLVDVVFDLFNCRMFSERGLNIQFVSMLNGLKPEIQKRFLYPVNLELTDVLHGIGNGNREIFLEGRYTDITSSVLKPMNEFINQYVRKPTRKVVIKDTKNDEQYEMKWGFPELSDDSLNMVSV